MKRNFIIIYLDCDVCGKKGDDAAVSCSDCEETSDQTIKFILLARHDKAYRE